MNQLSDLGQYILKLDHTAIAVRSIEEASKLYRDVLGGKFLFGRSLPEQGFRFEQYEYPNAAKIELLEPLDDEGFLARFLRTRGEGVHHLTFKVNRLAELVVLLRQRGYRIVGEDYSNADWREAFISPKNAHGTIVQLAESERL